MQFFIDILSDGSLYAIYIFPMFALPSTLTLFDTAFPINVVARGGAETARSRLRSNKYRMRIRIKTKITAHIM